jgi:hypothetical protein
MFIMLRSDADGEGFGIEGTLAALTLQHIVRPRLDSIQFHDHETSGTTG